MLLSLSCVVQSFTTVMGIMMLVETFLSRFVFQDPAMQEHPYRMIAYVFIALAVMGTGYVLPIIHREELREAALRQTRG